MRLTEEYESRTKEPEKMGMKKRAIEPLWKSSYLGREEL